MFKFTALLTVLVLAVLAVLLIRAYVRDQDRRWDEAMRGPEWEVSERTSIDGLTGVHLALMATDGRRSHTFRTTLVGTVDIAEPGWEIELEILREKAAHQAEVLNQARNKGGES